MNIKKSNYLIILLSVFTITSCGKNEKINLTTDEGLIKLKELVIEQFGEDLEIYSFSMSSKEDLSDDLGGMTISYFKEDGEIYSNTYNAVVYGEESNLEGEKKKEQITKIRAKWNTPEGNGKIKLKNLSFENIIPNIRKAMEILGDNVGTAYIKNYEIKAEPKTNAIISNFKLQFTPLKNATHLEGKRIITEYREAYFQVNANGDVNLKKK